ncbi:restriction endonuclease [Streptomyces sp. CB01201]|uniref:restriction endonuclease n=1 Tax=Streptomyces sp. CB01201 TaxID=2020324 RepID=UPI003FA353B5
MAEVDVLSWQEFETYIAALCRRDGCTKVFVSGRSGDLGADVIGYLSDGRKLVIQCKKYAPHRSVSSHDMQSSSALHAPNTARTSPCSSPPATASPRTRSAWRCARTSSLSTATFWAPGSKAPTWPRCFPSTAAVAALNDGHRADWSSAVRGEAGGPCRERAPGRGSRRCPGARSSTSGTRWLTTTTVTRYGPPQCPATDLSLGRPGGGMRACPA